jgi:hypothetical protein
MALSAERGEVPMALDTAFVAAVLEGIEGTLGELIERVEGSELQASLDVLQSRVTALRVSIFEPAHEVEEPLPVETAQTFPSVIPDGALSLASTSAI